MKTKLLIFALALLSTFSLATVASAAEPKLSSSEATNLSKSCETILQKLRTVQRTDSRTRNYFGAIYETVSTKFLKPLNRRLVSNDLASPALIELQTSFSDARTKFIDDYNSYFKSLDDLTNTRCSDLKPETFYQKLLETRKKRATVAADVKTLNELITSVVKNTEKLKEQLK